MQKLKRNFFPTLIALSALSVSVSAAFYSVSGLSKLFAGASFEVIIMAGSLEVAKLVIASLLYQYWSTLNKYLRTYLTVATVVLVLITSMGIYGFLSAAYQDTYRQLTVKENQTAFLEQKKQFYENDVFRYDEELKRISSNISTLSNARSQSIQVRDTSVAGGVRTTISTSELRMAAKRIEVEEENRKNVQRKREVVADSLQKYQLAILELDNNTEVAGELGPLQYLSGLTDIPMDKIINILLLIIIFVFDPLAISLVVAANFAFEQANKKTIYNEYDDPWDDLEEEETHSDHLYEEPNISKIKKSLEEIEVIEAEEVKPRSPYSSRMDIIGQNGNDGAHYSEEVSKTGNQLADNIEKILQKGPSRWRVLLKTGESVWVSRADALKHFIDPDLTKTY
jgi:hypothetical protein